MKANNQRRLSLFGCLTLIAALTFSACDSAQPARPIDEAADALAKTVPLTDAAAVELKSYFSAQRDNFGKVSFLWDAAKEIYDNLSEAEKQKLFERLDAAAIQVVKIGPHEGQGPWAGSMRDQIGLTEEQKAEIVRIADVYNAQARDLLAAYQDGRISGDDFEAQLDDVRRSKRNEMAAVLTAEQQAQADVIRAERRAAFDAYREEAFDVMTQTLGLTEEQRVAILALYEAEEKERRSMYDDFNLTLIDYAAVKAGFEMLYEARLDALKSILSQEQYEILVLQRALTFRLQKHQESLRPARTAYSTN